MWKLFILLISIVLFNEINCLKCNRFDKTIKHVFATKTNYDSSQSYFNASTLNDLQESISKYVPDTCSIDQLYMISRHSTRNPSLERIRYFERLYPKLIQSLSDEFDETKEDRSNCEYYLYYHMSKYRFRYNTTEASLIVKVGDEITRKIGERYGRVFGDLLSSNRVKLGVSKQKRTVQTLESFISGLQRSPSKYPIEEKSSMAFHDLGAELEKPEDPLIEKYKKSDRMKALRKSISKRFGLVDTLKFKDIHNLYQFCAFDYEIYKNPFWCNFFKDDDFDVYEFFLDAAMYRKLHSPLSTDHLDKSAVWFRDLRNFLIDSNQKVFFGFSHSEVLKVILAKLKMFEGGINLTDNFEDSFQQSSNREWRISRILPFNSNFAFLKYNCINSASNKTIPKILTLYQEQPVKIGNCDGLLCPLSTFLRFIFPFHNLTSGLNNRMMSARFYLN